MLAQGHNAVTQVRLEPAALRSRVKHTTTEPLRSLLVSVAEETGLKLALAETPKTGFVASRPNYGG